MLDRLSEYAAEAGGAASQIRESAFNLEAVARERLSEGTETIRKYVIEHPSKALGLALGMGVLLGWLIKRR